MTRSADEMLGTWCLEHLGQGPGEVVFRAGYFSQVVGVVLDDGRRIVVKIRPTSPRLAACAQVQVVLHAAGFPAPELLVAPTSYPDGGTASAEVLVEHAGGTGTTAGSAALLAEQVRLAPPPSADALAPHPAWVRWYHDEPGLWPTPDDGEVDLNSRRVDWIDRAAATVCDHLRADAGARVVGHVDWLPQNIWWNLDGTARAVHDWDSLAALSEPAVAGVAAAIFRQDATVDQSRDFLHAYQAATCRWTATQNRTAWAAGLWVRLFDAKKDLLAGRTNSLGEQQAHQRLATVGL